MSPHPVDPRGRDGASEGCRPRIVSGSLWDLMTDGYDAVGVPTNGEVHARIGTAVMGAGVAREAANRWRPWLQEHLGAAISRSGNHVFVFDDIVTSNPRPASIFSFPTKHKARDRTSDVLLIERSCHELMAHVAKRGWRKVIMPQPGTGLGKLSWSDVWRVISPILDERVHIAVLSQEVMR